MAASMTFELSEEEKNVGAPNVRKGSDILSFRGYRGLDKLNNSDWVELFLYNKQTLNSHAIIQLSYTHSDQQQIKIMALQ
jgi:hypothetical protein